MLIYHPIHDPYHASFRFLRILSACDSQNLDYLSLRILDFYLLFPAEIEHIVMPAQLRSWKLKFKNYRNRYYSSISKHSVFRQLSGSQQIACRLLSSREIIDISGNDSEIIDIDLSRLPLSLTVAISEANDAEEQLVQFLSQGLAEIELLGPMGLKKRTGLAEYKYDIV